MKRIACVVCVLLAAGLTFAAGPDPTVTLYTEVFDHLKVKPTDELILLRLRPPTDRGNAAQSEALDAIVDLLAAAAKEAPKDFVLNHNYYQAIWTRYAFYQKTADAAAAFEQLERTARLTNARSPERARCLFELADNTMALDPATARKLVGKDRKAVAIKRFSDAKRAAMSRGPYAARSALALVDLYISSRDAANAKTQIREALDLDKDRRGYVTNHAYDRFGLVLLSEGNVEGALAMLDAAGRVTVDADLKSEGFAFRLARALIVMKHAEEAIEYLDKVMKLVDEGKTALTYDIAYTTARGYTDLGKADEALIYWKRYVDMGDPDENRRERAIKIAQDLAVKASESDK